MAGPLQQFSRGGLTKQAGQNCVVCLWQAHEEQGRPERCVEVGAYVLVQLWAIDEGYDRQRRGPQLRRDLVHCAGRAVRGWQGTGCSCCRITNHPSCGCMLVLIGLVVCWLL